MREIHPSDLVNLLAAVADRAIKDATGSVKALPTRHRESAVLFLDECLPEWRRFIELRPMNCQASDRLLTGVAEIPQHSRVRPRPEEQ